MANYTMTINDCLNNPLTPLFNFNYPFYVDDVDCKNNFEEKFILYYLNCEIGFETFARFQKALEARLVVKMPYYQQLYETELRAKNIEFMLNKDYKETFIREVERSNTGELKGYGSQYSKSNDNQNSFSNGKSSQSEDSLNKQSMLTDGVSQATLDNGYLTGVSHNNGSLSNQSTTNNQQFLTSESNANQSQSSSSSGHSKDKETYTTIGQGNIGTTSSAQLLREWRDVLINMDELIIKDCRDLFMKIY